MAQCVFSISCECGRSYIGETGRPLVIWLHKQSHNLKEGLLEKSKLAKHAYKEGRRVVWDETRILEIESKSRHRKYKELTHKVCLINLISQPSLGISSLWIPLIIDEVTKSKRSLYNIYSPLVYSFKAFRLSFHCGNGANAPPPVSLFPSQFLYICVRNLVCWLDLCKKLLFPIVIL
jgi:hypothetical protein